jgi:hypothetical protein
MYLWLPVYFCISLQVECDACTTVEQNTARGCRANAWSTNLIAVRFDGIKRTVMLVLFGL